MSRSTIAIVVVFVVLLVAWLATQREAPTQEIPPLMVDGFLQGEISLQDIKVLNKDEESPYRRFEIEREGERFTLELAPGQESAKPSERKWLSTRTKGEKTFSAPGESYRVKMINQVLARSFRSTYAFVAKPEELGEYGLDAAQAVKLTASSADRKVVLILGKSEKNDDEASTSTWVQSPDRPDVVYQVKGHDLRTEVGVGWKDVRDRKILAINLAAIDKVELNNPRSAAGRGAVKASRPPLTEEQRQALASGKKPEEVRKSDEGWKIDEPQGYAAGDIGSWLESIERMSMTESYDLTDGKRPADSGLDDATKAVVITIHEGDKATVVRIGERAPKGDQQDVYAAVDGETIVYSLANWSAEQIVKDLDNLRDLRLLGARKAAEATALRIVGADGAAFVTRKSDQGWTSTDVDLDPKSVEDWLRDLDSTRVEFRVGKDLASIGLDKPAIRIELTLPDGPLLLTASARISEKVYGRVGEGDPFELQSWNADRLARTGRDFVDKHLLRIPVAEVTSVTVPDDAKTKTLVRAEGGWKVEGDPAVAVDASKVNGLLDALAQYSYHIEVDSDAKSVGLEPAPWTLTIVAGTRTWALSLSESRRDNNPYALLREGSGRPKLVTISAMMVDQFRKTLKDLK